MEQREAWVSLGSLTPRKMGLAGGLLISEGEGEANSQAWGLH